MKKKIIILGSTGSIGKSTINIIKKFPNKFNIVALSTNKNITLISNQSKLLKVKNLIIHDFKSYLIFKKRNKKKNKYF